MPGLSGAEPAVKILAVTPAVPIILCIGFSEQVIREKGMEIGNQGLPREVGAYLLWPNPCDRKALRTLAGPLTTIPGGERDE
jgi:hypothetical protein